MTRRRVRWMIGGLVGMAVGMVPTTGWADESSGPMRKLGRGMANVAYGFWELPIKIVEVRNVDGPVAASTLGVIKGLTAGFQRTMVGVYEVLTFPFPQPTGTYEPMIEPEFLRLRR